MWQMLPKACLPWLCVSSQPVLGKYGLPLEFWTFPSLELDCAHSRVTLSSNRCKSIDSFLANALQPVLVFFLSEIINQDTELDLSWGSGAFGE